MVACIIALVVLGVMSIFSAKYRSWFKESLACVTRRFVLKPCNTGFDEKVKSIVTAKLLKRNKKVARFTHKHFEVISWMFMIIFVISIIFTAQTVYNLAVFGTCTPGQDDGTCIFTPADSSCGQCGTPNCSPESNYAACNGDCNCDSGSEVCNG